jgi:hypothetical protein
MSKYDALLREADEWVDVSTTRVYGLVKELASALRASEARVERLDAEAFVKRIASADPALVEALAGRARAALLSHDARLLRALAAVLKGEAHE